MSAVHFSEHRQHEHKRILADWQLLLAAHQKNVDNGRKGGKKGGNGRPGSSSAKQEPSPAAVRLGNEMELNEMELNEIQSNGIKSARLLETEQAVGRSVSSVCESSFSSKSKTERDRWLEFINDPKAGIPDSLKYAEPRPEERAKVLAQLDAVVIEGWALKNGTTKAEWLGNSISDWEEQQSPPLSTLNYGRWKRWLETGDPNA